MNKYSLINKANREAGISRHLSEFVFDFIITQIKNQISEQKYFFADYLGEFIVERRKMETREDYKLNALVLIPPKDKIVFKFFGDNPVESKTFGGLEIVKSAAKEFSISEDKVYEFYISLFKEISKAVLKGKNVNISEFGKFRLKNDKVKYSPARKFAKEINFNFCDLKQSVVKYFEAPVTAVAEKEETPLQTEKEIVEESPESIEAVSEKEEIVTDEIYPVEEEFIPPVPDYIPPESFYEKEEKKEFKEPTEEPWMKAEPTFIPEIKPGLKSLEEPFYIFDDFDVKVEPQIIKERKEKTETLEKEEIFEPITPEENIEPIAQEEVIEPITQEETIEPDIIREVITEKQPLEEPPVVFENINIKEEPQIIKEPVVTETVETPVVEEPEPVEKTAEAEEIISEEELFEEDFRKSEERFEREREEFEKYLEGKEAVPPSIKFESYTKPIEYEEQPEEKISMPEFSLDNQSESEKQKLEEEYQATIQKFQEERRKLEEELDRLMKSDIPLPEIKPAVTSRQAEEETGKEEKTIFSESDLSNLDVWDDDIDPSDIGDGKQKKDDDEDFPKSMNDIFSKL